MDVLAQFPRVWCPTCNKTQPMIFDVMKANDKNEHNAADIVCAECKSIIATLHAPSAFQGWFADDASGGSETYEAGTWLACRQVPLMRPRTCNGVWCWWR